MFSRIPNLRIHEFLSQNCACFLLKQGKIFLLISKLLVKLFIFTKKTLCSSLERKQDIFCEKKIVDSKFVKTCHEPHLSSVSSTLWQSIHMASCWTLNLTLGFSLLGHHMSWPMTLSWHWQDSNWLSPLNSSGQSSKAWIRRDKKSCSSTGKSLSEALIFASTNPHYDERLFIELQVQLCMKIPSSEHGENMLCTVIVSDIKNNFCTQLFVPMFCKKKSLWQRFTCSIKMGTKALMVTSEVIIRKYSRLCQGNCTYMNHQITSNWVR